MDDHPEHNADQEKPGQTCPQCGTQLPPNLPAALCPKCLLKEGLGPAAQPGNTMPIEPQVGRSLGLPQPGEELGHYRIVRSLGGGGMGNVYEAEDLETGRRVALKVLSQALDSPQARERFMREGRMAASINHPNSVYVFGTEEIGGTPVIAMELVSGGTLEERVREKGPLPPAEAVDIMLDIVAGLESAQRLGILHRDVKPSNCFIDLDGTVKIGDFGLSISTAIRTEPALTATGVFLGTPAFCSPEQLRGEELTQRADMYSVGATLFYLLTGRTPFEAKNVVALIATVLEQPAPSVTSLRKDIPPGLAKVVRRCLEKQPGERFKNYDELAQALRPYSSDAPAPATLGLRLVAGMIDTMVLGMGSGLVLLALSLDPMEMAERIAGHSPQGLLLAFTGFFVSLLYYSVLEGFWGATLGKSLCRLRVTRPQRAGPPGFGRALVRATIYTLFPALPAWLFFGASPRSLSEGSSWAQFMLSGSFYMMLALLFGTARRRNGFAALQDLATGTRVISRLPLKKRPAMATAPSTAAGVEDKPRVGPYYVLEKLEESPTATWLVGYDVRLLRKVWLRLLPAETPPVSIPLRNLRRTGRLRWLTGRRSANENWDAYEFLSGRPLLKAATTPHPWEQVRYWLADLATELSIAEKDGTLPVLGLDRVWLTEEGTAKLLDFNAPGLEVAPAADTHTASQSPSPPAANAAQQFLTAVAHTALRGGPSTNAGSQRDTVPPRLPLHARDFLHILPTLSNADVVLQKLRPLLQRIGAVTRRRRAALVGGCIVFPMIAAVMMMFGLRLTEQWNRRNPGLIELNNVLQQRWAMHLFGQAKRGPTDEQYAVFVASHYGPVITNKSWHGLTAAALIQGDKRRFAEASLREHPSPTPEQVKAAEDAIRPLLPKEGPMDLLRKPLFPLMAGFGCLLIYVGLPAIFAALIFRGGLVLRVAGVSFVRKDGQPASRLRLFWRALVSWSIVFPAFIGFVTLLDKHNLWAGILVMLAVLALVAISLALPQRGLQDRLAGTWPVPR